MSNQGNINLPDALKTKPLPTISTMSVDTNILDPVICNNTFARFVLEKKGILDAGSVFTFSLTNNDADMDGRMFLPLKTGIHALIRSAVLRVGTKIISNNEDYAYYQTIKRQFKTTEEKQFKDMVKYGTQEGLEPANSGNGKFQLSSVVYTDNALTGEPVNMVQIKNDRTTTPTFQIKLSELFPMLRSVQLPLFVFNEPVSIELTFRTQADGGGDLGKLACAGTDPGGITYNTGCNLDTQSVKFLADYLTYDDNTMAKTAAQVMSAQGIQMPYEDLLLTIGNVPAQAAAAAVENNKTTTEIAVAGRLVRQFVVHTSNNADNELMGRYASTSHQNPDTYNLRINDMLFYPNDITRESQKQHELSKCFGRDIEIHNAEYSLDLLTNKQDAANAINNQLIEGTLAGRTQTWLNGAQHFLGIDLSKSPMNIPGNGTLIGQKPIQFSRTFRRVPAENQALTQRIFSLVERNMIIKNGSVQVSN
tara:strand:- start:1453 stop:2886 length:1434 start_codon:yes stop_codon:yes gene_type:complete